MEKLIHAETRLTQPWDKRRVYVDRGIAPLIKALWKIGCPTIFSCEGGEGEKMSITFYTAAAVERFFWRVRSVTDKEKWTVGVPYPLVVEEGQAVMLWTVQFPRDDYQRVLNRVL